MGIKTTRVLVLFEPGRNGTRALREGVAAAAETDAELTVVTLAPQASPTRCAGPSPEPYNEAVRDEAELELRAARELVWGAGNGATFTVLADHRDPPLEQWVIERGFELIFLPRHRLSGTGHPVARRLRRSTTAELRFVG